MRVALLSLAALTLTPLAFQLGACSAPPSAGIALQMTAPAGVLDEATSVELRVFPVEGASCRADGSSSVLPASAAKFKLSKDNCSGGATWCGELSLEEDGSEQMFVAQVSSAAGILAQGCATATIDQDPVEVDIKVVRFVPPACCGDGVLQAGELCDTGPAGGACGQIADDGICTADCSTRAVPVDFTTMSLGAIGQGSLGLAIAGGTAELDGAVRAVWQNTASDNSDIGVRYLRPDTRALSDPGFGVPHRLTLDCDGSDSPLLRNQRSPSVSTTGSTAVIAFLSNYNAPLRYDIQITELGANGCNSAQPLTIDVDDANDAVALDVAAHANGNALVVWEQNSGIFARTYGIGSGTLGMVTTIANGRAPRVAATNSGWIVSYQGADAGDDDGIFLRNVSSGMAVSAARLVNAQTQGAQDQADIFALPDGRYAVAWRSGGDVFAQRFAANDAPLAGDQDNPLHQTRDGEQAAPAVGGSGQFFAVVWESGTELRARLLGADGGFLFNGISGQNDDFPVTTGAGQPRRPAIVAGSYLIFGWEDQGTSAPGMYVRRFPIPS